MAREVAQLLPAPALLPEDLSLVPHTHIGSESSQLHAPLALGNLSLFWLVTSPIHICPPPDTHTHTHAKKKKKEQQPDFAPLSLFNKF